MHPLIARELAKPVTHIVVTTYVNGKSRLHQARGAAQAENWAIGERRKIGQNLIDRESGEVRTVMSVEIVEV